MNQASITLKGYEDLLQDLTFLQKSQLARVIQDSLNKEVAPALRKNERQEMQRTFKSTVPFTLNAPMTSQWANFNSLAINFKLRDEVAKGNAPDKYLYPQTVGGEVYVTRLTRRLQYQGLIAESQYLVHWGFGIGPGARSRSGRVTGGFVQQVLAGLSPDNDRSEYFVLGGEKSQRANANRNRTGTRPSRNTGYDGPGVYTRKGGKLARVFRILNSVPTVQKRYDWSPERIGSVAEPVFRAAVQRRLAEAMKLRPDWRGMG